MRSDRKSGKTDGIENQTSIARNFKRLRFLLIDLDGGQPASLHDSSMGRADERDVQVLLKANRRFGYAPVNDPAFSNNQCRSHMIR